MWAVSIRDHSAPGIYGIYHYFRESFVAAILPITIVNTFWGHVHAFLRRPWVLSRAFRCGAHRGPACTPRCRFGSRPGSVARALGVQCHEIWHVVAGLLSDQLEPTGPVQPRKLSFVFHFSPFFVLLLLTHHSN